jgi:hypothetical protein
LERFNPGRDSPATTKGKYDCATGWIHAESFLDGRATRRSRSEETQAPHHDHCRFCAGIDFGDDCHFAVETSSAERRSLTVWIDTVKRGPMVRQVRGLGTLVPEEIRWIPANTEGRVEKIIVWPGTQVEPDTVILELTSPELEQTAHDAELQATAAEAELTTLRATLQREVLDQESTTARVHSEYEQAKMERHQRPTG